MRQLDRISARDLSVGGLFAALGVVIPILFHAAGAGMIFLPMHLPVLLCGLIVSPRVAFSVGFVTPLVSSLLTGMPPLAPIGLMMSVELATLAGVAGIMRRLGAPVFVAIPAAILAARIVGASERLALAPLMGLKENAVAYLLSSVIFSWPGILMQLAVAPAAYATLQKISKSRKEAT